MCAYIGDGGKAGRLVKIWWDLDRAKVGRNKHKKGRSNYSWIDFLQLYVVGFLAGESDYVKWLKLLSFTHAN